LTVSNGSSLQLISGGVVQADQVLVAGSTVSGAGTVNARFAAIGGALVDVTGTMLIGDSMSHAGVGGDAIFNVASHTLTLLDKGFAQIGSIDIAGGQVNAVNGLLVGGGGAVTGYGMIAGPIVTDAATVVSASGGGLALGSSSAVNGVQLQGVLEVGGQTVTLLDANASALGSLTTIDGGTLISANGIQLDFGKNLSGHGIVSTASGEFQNNGDVFGGTGGDTLEFLHPVTGVGDFFDDVTFTGGLSPGLSPAEVKLDDFTFSASNTLTMELGGVQPGAQHDALSISGLGKLDGTLDVQLIDGFNPEVANFFKLFDGATQGAFTTIDLPAVDVGLMWNIGFLYTTGELLSTFMGDINGDLMVGVTDLGMLANQWGTGGFGQFNADITGDGTVSVTDLGALAANWGAAVGPSLGGARVVPTPSAWLNVPILLGCLASRRRRA